MKGRTYADITSVTPVMAGMEAQVPQASNFTIPGGSPAPAQPAPAQPVQPTQATTTVTVEQPQTVQPGTGSNVFTTFSERSVLIIRYYHTGEWSVF